MSLKLNYLALGAWAARYISSPPPPHDQPSINMLASLRHVNAAISAVQRQINRFFFFPQPPTISPQLALAGSSIPLDINNDNNSTTSTLEDALWFAVPKSKISRGKKRLKTTLQKRIKVKDNIIIDKRTGELTLKHKLPYNWRNYLPENAEHAP